MNLELLFISYRPAVRTVCVLEVTSDDHAPITRIYKAMATNQAGQSMFPAVHGNTILFTFTDVELPIIVEVEMPNTRKGEFILTKELVDNFKPKRGR